MFNYLDDRKKKKDTFLTLHDAVTLLTTLLVPEIKMAAHRYVIEVSVQSFLQGQGQVAKKNILRLRELVTIISKQ